MIETVCLFKCELKGFVKINSTQIISTYGRPLISLFSVFGNCYFIWSAKITPVPGPEMKICARERERERHLLGPGDGGVQEIIEESIETAATSCWASLH